MKKITYPLLLVMIAVTVFNCTKNRQEISTPDALTGLWSETSLHYKAYKGTQVIEEYTEATAGDEQITIQFFEDGRFETYERSLEDGKWEVTWHARGTYIYTPGTGSLILENAEAGEHTEATVLTLSGQQLVFSQTASPASNNAEADKETFTFDFKRVP
ncbi:hypothetical protein [Niabella beijingensis]|uniref:hypothetical protein n=1 Tax=Niabella beijingensis TaxID=2872700 RepID=UPI001CBA9A68|nr:hypothetical protein [Niabella beijingensis]MBZ4188759.1 hypothetical protein [Niabella beijingensis]